MIVRLAFRGDVVSGVSRTGAAVSGALHPLALAEGGSVPLLLHLLAPLCLVSVRPVEGIAWKVLLPLVLVNIMITALIRLVGNGQLSF